MVLIMRAESSPRMRGARDVPLYKATVAGIIPADAGSTFRLMVYRMDARDHPRGCGEHITTGARKDWKWGSSPRMRGALEVLGDACDGPGIIPADAGSTF